MTLTVEKRRKMERAVVSRFLRDAIKAGYTVSVCDGEAWVLKKSAKVREIMAAMFSVDEETLGIWQGDKKVGNVFLVYGNDGWDVINDYHTSLEHLMAGATEVSDRLQAA